MTAAMQANGNKEKTGFMEKEADFIKQLKKVQDYHIVQCTKLLQFSIFGLVLEFIFACFCIIYFKCLDDCENNLVCSLYYIKFFQTLFLISTYQGNIKEK